MANPLTKEAGGQPVWAWGAELVGALVVFHWYRSRRAAAGAAAAMGTTSGPPASGAGGGLSSGSMPAAPANLQEWINSALGGLTGPGYGPTQAFNDITQWLSGGCVSSAGFNALGGAIASLGTPPGYTTAPPITVCQTNPGQGTSGAGSTPSGTGAAPPPAPAPSPSPGWVHIPDPTAGSLISNVLGAEYQTVGNAQYYNPSQVVEITDPNAGSSLLGQGFNVVGFGGHEWYNPTQAPTPGQARYVNGG